jgi:glycosyltransferase involved in cell wall biosynthesis
VARSKATNAINPMNSKMNELPSISIIIPTLNSAKILKDCLESIAMQDYSEELLEIIMVDGGSTNGTLEIINFYGLNKLASLINPIKLLRRTF